MTLPAINQIKEVRYYSIASSQFNIAIDTKDNSSYSSRKRQSQHREEEAEEDEEVISISLSLKYNCTHTNTHRGNNGTFPSLHQQQQQQQHTGRKRKLSTRFSPSQPSSFLTSSSSFGKGHGTHFRVLKFRWSEISASGATSHFPLLFHRLFTFLVIKYTSVYDIPVLYYYFLSFTCT